MLPLLQTLWRTKRARKGCSTRCPALQKLDQVTMEPLPALCLVLASMGGLEPGPACYFLEPGWSRDKSTPRPGRLARLSDQMNSLEVLAQVGCPDYMDEFTEKGRQGYLWGSQWDYYTQTPLEVTRLLWEPGSPFTPADVKQRLRELLSF